MPESLYDQPPAPIDDQFYPIYPEFYDLSNANHSADTASQGDDGGVGHPPVGFSAMGQIEGGYPDGWDFGLGNVELEYPSSSPGIVGCEEGQALQPQAPFDGRAQAYPAMMGDIMSMADSMSQYIPTEETMSGYYELPSWPPPQVGQISPSPSQSSYYASSSASGCGPHFSRHNSFSSLPASRAAFVEQGRFDARFWPVPGQVVSPGESQLIPGRAVVNGDLPTVMQSSSSADQKTGPPRQNRWDHTTTTTAKTTSDHTVGTLSSAFTPSSKDRTTAAPFQPASPSARHTPDYQTPKSSGNKALQPSKRTAQQKYAAAGQSQEQQAQPPSPPQYQPRPQAQQPPLTHQNQQPEKPPPARRKRSREAANKCRAKAKLAAADLESTERALGSEHRELSATARGLRDEVLLLKNELLAHGNCDDCPIQEYLFNQARVVSAVGAGASAAAASASESRPRAAT